MSWECYVNNLMSGENCQDCAIVGYEDKIIWASHRDGILGKITQQEIDALMADDRTSIYIDGVTLASKKCSVLRDGLLTEGDLTMDMRTKSQEGEPTCNITVAKSKKALIVLMGKGDIHCGSLNKKAYDMAQHLRKSGY